MKCIKWAYVVCFRYLRMTCSETHSDTTSLLCGNRGRTAGKPNRYSYSVFKLLTLTVCSQWTNQSLSWTVYKCFQLQYLWIVVQLYSFLIFIYFSFCWSDQVGCTPETVFTVIRNICVCNLFSFAVVAPEPEQLTMAMEMTVLWYLTLMMSLVRKPLVRLNRAKVEGKTRRRRMMKKRMKKKKTKDQVQVGANAEK